MAYPDIPDNLSGKTFAECVAHELGLMPDDPQVQVALRKKMGYIIRITRKRGPALHSTRIVCSDLNDLTIQVTQHRGYIFPLITVVSPITAFSSTMITIVAEMLRIAQDEAHNIVKWVESKSRDVQMLESDCRTF